MIKLFILSIIFDDCITIVIDFLNTNLFNNVTSQTVLYNQDSVIVIASASYIMNVNLALKDLTMLYLFLINSEYRSVFLNELENSLLIKDKNKEIITQNVHTIEVIRHEFMCEKAFLDFYQLKTIRLKSLTENYRLISVNLKILTRMTHDNDLVR